MTFESSSQSELINLVNRYKTGDERDVTMKTRMLDFIKRYTNCCERTLQVGHITASAALVDTSFSKILLTHHKKLDCWLQLGGHADGSVDVLEVALREATEESGINEIEPISKEILDIDIHEISANSKEPHHLHYDIRFALRASLSDAYEISDESNDLAWVNFEDLIKYTKEPSMHHLVRKLACLRPRN